MIKVRNLEKYFNKGQSNEIHVINDLNLDLPDKGLVVLVGPSGSGKTTLLNVLGGLDKVQSGSITFGNEEIKRYNSATWDKIRNQKVGYIFQNYNLLLNLTVYDNIALTLNMIGIYDKEEIDKRIDYILERIGMINYRKRRASQLSGGQQQRVAIARALAKNPKVIIADEPTGNLDSKNTQEVMEIIKRISLTKLVVLVTHEENIANFYADRIIRLSDGQVVSNDVNTSNGTLDVKHDTDIYLGDLRAISNVEDTNNTFKLYSDEDIEDKVNVRLIVKNKTIYIDLKSKEYKKVQLIESDSEINIFEKKYQKINRNDVKGVEKFDLESIISPSDEIINHSVFSVKDSVRLAWTRMKTSTMFGKLFYLGFVFIAGLIALAVGMLNGIFTHAPEEFLKSPRELIEISKGELDYTKLLAYTTEDSINYVQVIESVDVTVNLPSVYQSWQNTTSLTGKVAYSEFMNESKLVAGTKVNDYNEIVISQRIADAYIKDNTYQQLGITSYQDLMNLILVKEFDSQNGKAEYEMKIVGIVKDDAKVIYMKKDTIFFLSNGIGTLEMFGSSVTVTDEQSQTDKVLVYQAQDGNDYSTILGNKMTTLSTVDVYLEALYTSTKDVPLQLFSSDDLELLLVAGLPTSPFSTVYYHASDVDNAIKALDSDEIEATSVYDNQKQAYASVRIPEALSTIIFSVVVLAASAIMYFLVIRSNLLGRIYEVSVYRGLGVSKNDIRKMFTTEIIMISTMTSLVGYVVMTYMLYRIQLISADYMDIVHINPLSIIGGIILIYGVNIVSGLIPVSNLIRKTPAEIFSKYDF